MMQTSDPAKSTALYQSKTVRHGIRAIVLLLLTVLWPSFSVAQTYTPTPTPFQTAFDNSGNIINGSCVWTYTAGTTTAATTYTTPTGTANSNPIIADSAGRFVAYLTPGQSYKYVYESACTPPSHGSTLRTQDNIPAMPAQSGNVDITGAAGETLAAGNVVYLSDGSGGKAAGSWYKADADNTYSSSTAGMVGIATAAITSGSSGAIRLSGRMTGLTGLSAGSVYYVSATAGAMTTTAPSNARILGSADGTTTFVFDSNPQWPSVTQAINIVEGRLSLTTAVPVTTSDVTAATTLYYALYKGNRIGLYNGSAWVTVAVAQLSIAVPATTSQMYDVFVDYNAGTPALELVAWTNDTTRAVALATQNGVYVQTSDADSRYVGSFRTTGVSGQTEDSLAKRYVWNYYNRVLRPMRVTEASNSWTYTTDTWRQANAAAGNQIDMVIGVSEDIVVAQVVASASNSTSSVYASVGIGLDSTSAAATGLLTGSGSSPANATFNMQASWRGYPTVGRHVLVWLERSQASGTCTWYSYASLSPPVSGISGEIWQ